MITPPWPDGSNEKPPSGGFAPWLGLFEALQTVIMQNETHPGYSGFEA